MTEPTLSPQLNQYAPPTATVEDVAPEHLGTARLNMFSAEGRIGRLRYLAYVTGASLIQGFVIGIVTAVIGGPVLIAVVNAALYIAMIWFCIICGIKRCHDMDISGWWSVTVLIPIIALLWAFWPGSKGANRFGPPPPPNNLGVRILGLLLPVIFFIGIVAAIALPAYSTYQMKAKARAAQSAGQL